MSFDTFPIDILPKYVIMKILDYAFPRTNDDNQLMKDARGLVTLTKNKKMREITREMLRNLGDAHLLVNKYTSHGRNHTHDHHLYDALSTGCGLPLGMGSIKEYDNNVGHDIIKIVKLLPGNLDFSEGELMYRTKVTPLFMACVNHKIPLPIVAFLIQSKANPNSTIRVDGEEKKIIEDLEDLSIERKDQLVKLLSSTDTEAIEKLANIADDEVYHSVVPKPKTEENRNHDHGTVSVRRANDQREGCYSKTKDKCILN